MSEYRDNDNKEFLDLIDLVQEKLKGTNYKIFISINEPDVEWDAEHLHEDWLDNLKMTIELDDNDYSPIVVFSRYTRVARFHLEMMEHIVGFYGFEKDICDLVNQELTENYI